MDPRKIKDKYHLFFFQKLQLLKTRVISLILLAPMRIFHFAFMWFYIAPKTFITWFSE